MKLPFKAGGSRRKLMLENIFSGDPLHGLAVMNENLTLGGYQHFRLGEFHIPRVLFERLTRMEKLVASPCPRIVGSIFNRSIYNSLFIAFRLIRIASGRERAAFHSNNNH